MISCSKFVVWDIFIGLRPSGLVNRLGDPKQVIIGFFRRRLGGTVSFGFCSLLHIIQVQLLFNSESILLFGICSVTIIRMIGYV